jgi:hypothetical protein
MDSNNDMTGNEIPEVSDYGELNRRPHVSHPVILSANANWISNHKGKNIFWIHPKIHAGYSDLEHQFARHNWRWSRNRLIVEGNSDSSGRLMILDFSRVDVEIPTPYDTYKTLGYMTMSVSVSRRAVTLQHQ